MNPSLLCDHRLTKFGNEKHGAVLEKDFSAAAVFSSYKSGGGDSEDVYGAIRWALPTPFRPCILKKVKRSASWRQRCQ